MSVTKLIARHRRARKTRAMQRKLGALRLVINRTPKHIYAQVIKAGDQFNKTITDKVLAQASTLDPAIKKLLKNTGNVDAAKVVGQHIAKRAIEIGISELAFDRSGFKYHGRVQALADAARSEGLKF